MNYVVYRDSIHHRWWTVYAVTEKYGRCLVPHQRGFKRKRDAMDYVIRVLTSEV